MSKIKIESSKKMLREVFMQNVPIQGDAAVVLVLHHRVRRPDWGEVPVPRGQVAGHRPWRFRLHDSGEMIDYPTRNAAMEQHGKAKLKRLCLRKQT